MIDAAPLRDAFRISNLVTSQGARWCRDDPTLPPDTKESVDRRVPVQVLPCPFCSGEHRGNFGDEQTFEAVAAFDPEAAVFFDRDVVEDDAPRGLCGPRIRQNAVGLFAHYGQPFKTRYVVYRWEAEPKIWKIYIATEPT